MTKKTLKFHYITLLIFCQALAFCTLFLPAKAASNEITIICPAESAANSDISCTLGGKTTSEINNITLTIISPNLKIKEFKPASGWTNNNSTTSTSLNLSSNTPTSSSFSLGTLIFTAITANQSETIVLEGIEFQKTDNYRFSAAGTEASIKITKAPITPTCAEDEELVNGVCTKKQKICAANEELVNGECVKKTPTCADDEELINNECIKKPQTCAENEELIDEKCVKKETICEEDEELVDGECIKKNTSCKKDEELIDGECKKKEPICKSDEKLVDGECVKKIITPVCKDDEELVGNACQKKKPKIDWTLIAIIAGGSILIIGIIIAIILVVKKGKKGAGINGYTSFSSSPNLSTGFRTTVTQSSTGNYSPRTQAQTNPTQVPMTETTVQSSNNGTFLARSGEIIEDRTESAANTDPRLKMQIQNPNQNIAPAPTSSNNPLTNEIMEDRTESAANTDPRLKMQIQNPNQNIAPAPTSSNNPLTNEIEQGTAMASYDDPRLQYNFSGNKPIIPQSQPQAQQPQAPIVSAYDLATQAAARAEQPVQQVIQAAPIATSQPTGPATNQPQQSSFTQNSQYRPSTSVPLSAPTNPTVFES